MALVHERTIPTERPSPVGEVFADRGVSRGQRNGSPRPLISVFWTGAAPILTHVKFCQRLETLWTTIAPWRSEKLIKGSRAPFFPTNARLCINLDHPHYQLRTEHLLCVQSKGTHTHTHTQKRVLGTQCPKFPHSFFSDQTNHVLTSSRSDSQHVMLSHFTLTNATQLRRNLCHLSSPIPSTRAILPVLPTLV